jgi:rubrerythrin
MKRWMIGMLGLVAVLGFAAGCGKSTTTSAVPPTATLANLQAAYNGESNAQARYEAFAAKADAEGYKTVASLFRATAKSEAIHAKKHAAMITKMGAEPKMTAETPEVKGTKENLEAAIKGETGEKDSMYPDFIKQAEADKNDGAAMTFKGAMASEVSHAELFKKALAELDSWKAGDKEFYVCTVCGYTTMDGTLAKCPICAAPREKFETVK